MPELVAKGPIIPVRLMNELDSRRVVFFCGSGISKGPASNLPSFVCLVKHVYQANRLEPDDIEREALDLDTSEDIDVLYKENPDRRRRPNLDKALGLLEREDRLGAEVLRRSVIERLSQPRTGSLVTHKALIKLSCTAKGVRLITTNFDNRFVETRLLEEKLVDAAPKLPVPKPHNWSSLVHLHGRIVPDDDGSNLVLTAADFGRAYLTERWAARFITELFREFAVVFVGYSLDDPVMSYMVDALAAERAKGARLEMAYAFADHDGGESSKQKMRDGWLAKNVEPILYDKKGDHKLLGDTLVEWARIKTDPYLARKQMALNGISKLPSGPNDPVVERVTWALEDPVAAEALANAPPISDERDFPKLEQWLDMFAEAGLLSRPAQVADGNQTDQGNSSVQLVGSDARTHYPPDLDIVTRHLAYWMARHLHVPQVLAWVLKKGGYLHPLLRDQVRKNLAAPVVEIPEKLRHLWTILVGSTPTDWREFLWISEQMQAASESVRRRIEDEAIRSRAPHLIVRSGPSPLLSLRRTFNKNPRPIPPMDACGHLELLVGDEGERHQIQQILDDAGVLSRNAETLTDYLVHALTLLADIGDSYSYSNRPSIAAHDQNRHRADWTNLIDLVRDSYFALADSNRARARNLLDRWVLSRQPLFKRLALHALTDDLKSDIRLARKLLVTGRKPGLWEIELRREVLRFLRLAGLRLPRNLRTEIVRAIHAGPKSKLMEPETIHQEKILCLSRLLQAGATLDKKSKALAEKGMPPDERDEFLLWFGEARWIDPKEFAPENLLTGTIADLASALSSGQIDFDAFRGLTLQKPVKVVSALRRLAKRHEWPQKFWEWFLWHIATLRHQQKLSGKLEKHVARVLEHAPDDLFLDVGSAAAVFVKDFAETHVADREESFRTLWSKAWKGVSRDGKTGSNDPITEAFGDVAGCLAEAALFRLWKYESKANAGLPESVRSYFDGVATDPKGHLGRVILASRLYELFTIDPDWTREYLIPLLGQLDSDETRERTRDLWAGYAWSPQVGPNLFAAFKESFLKVLTTYENLRSLEENLIRLFIDICLEAPNELTPKEIREVVASLSEEALVISLQALTHRLNGEPAERAQAWKDKVKPWLKKYWPPAAWRNTTRTSEAMLKLLVECGDAFPDAVFWSLSCLKPIKGDDLYGLQESDHVEQHRDATFQLLKKVVNDDVLEKWKKDCLREILESLIKEDSQLSADPEYQRLYNIAIC